MEFHISDVSAHFSVHPDRKKTFLCNAVLLSRLHISSCLRSGIQQRGRFRGLFYVTVEGCSMM